MMMNSRIKILLALPLITAMYLTACSSEGIDRNPDASLVLSDRSGGTTPTNNNFANSIGTPGPNRYVLLNKLKFEATLPSVITVLFQASDQYGKAIAGLQTRDFKVLEDNEPVSVTETSLSIVPHDELPFSLRTVLMVDNSSSILPDELNRIKTALISMIVDTNGATKLLPQQEIALYTFDDTVTLVKDFSSNAGSLIDAIRSIQPARAITPTNLYGAVIAGTAQWEDHFDLKTISQGTLIIITDGNDTAARHSYREATKAVAGKSVYTLGVGNELAPQVMSALGTSGTYALRNFDQLQGTMQSIAQQVKDTANSFYYLHYASPKRQAEGGESRSQHKISLSVIDNANKSSSGKITDNFNSSEFTNVEAEVVIAGPQSLEIGQQALYRATTRWGPTPNSDYLWTTESNNTTCSLEPAADNSVWVTAAAEGVCTISAHDQLAGGARNWRGINVLSD